MITFVPLLKVFVESVSFPVYCWQRYIKEHMGGSDEQQCCSLFNASSYVCAYVFFYIRLADSRVGFRFPLRGGGVRALNTLTDSLSYIMRYNFLIYNFFVIFFINFTRLRLVKLMKKWLKNYIS